MGDEGAKGLGQGLKGLINLNSLTLKLEQKRVSFANKCKINNEKYKAKKFLIKSFAKNIFLITKIQFELNWR